MMKKVILAALLMAALPQLAAAQVEKQVEVTKAYVPRVESASKLAVEPDMTDTTQMRPEIDYAITPLSLRTTLTTRPIRPATVTYWEFNRPLPFYLKVGAGYPLNSVLDFYATTQNPSTGYLTGYVNHEGRYADIRNDFGVADNNSMQMKNRAGVAAGKYLGRHILEGELSYDNRMYHRYGAFAAPGSELAPAPGSMVDFGDANLLLRFGDGFQNLERTNFEVVLSGGMFFDHSDWAAGSDPGQQLSLEGYGRIARGAVRVAHQARLLRLDEVAPRDRHVVRGAAFGEVDRPVHADILLGLVHERVAHDPHLREVHCGPSGAQDLALEERERRDAPARAAAALVLDRRRGDDLRVGETVALRGRRVGGLRPCRECEAEGDERKHQVFHLMGSFKCFISLTRRRSSGSRPASASRVSPPSAGGSSCPCRRCRRRSGRS